GGGRMAAVEHYADLTLDRGDYIGTFGLSIKDAQDVDAGVVAHERERNDDGFVFDFGEAEGGDALAKNTDYCEGELAHADGAADGIVEAEDAVCKLLGDEADFAAGLHVGGIEVAAAEDDKAPNILVALGDADQIDRALAGSDDDGHGEFARAGNLLDTGDSGFDGVHVVDGELVAERLAFAAGVDELDPDQVGADGFDLADDEFLCGEGDGDDENDGGAADDDAERGEDGAEFVGAQGVDGDGESFADVHHGVIPFQMSQAEFHATRAISLDV